MPTITEQLRHAVTESAQTRYAIAKGAEVDQSVLLRFVAGGKISGDTVDKLADYFGLELKPRARKR